MFPRIKIKWVVVYIITIQKSKKKKFNVILEKAEIKKMIDRLPQNDEIFKFLSSGHFSSIAFIDFVSDFAKINTLCASSLAIGKKHIMYLDFLKSQEKINNAIFVVSSVMEKGVKEYGYFDIFKSVVNKNKWNAIVKNNHAKVILFDTDIGKYVLETSSNLSENPKIEQFSFEKSNELFDFYYKNLFEGGAIGQ